MKIGLGLYRHMLTRDYYDFARQAGCTHVVAHLVDYFNQATSNPRNNQPTGSKYDPWGVAGDPNQLWTTRGLMTLRAQIEDAGLFLAAIENIDPAHWHHAAISFVCIRRLALSRTRQRPGSLNLGDELRRRTCFRQRCSLLGDHLRDLPNEGAWTGNVDRHNRALAGGIFGKPIFSHHAEASGVGWYFLALQRRRLVDDRSGAMAHS